MAALWIARDNKRIVKKKAKQIQFEVEVRMNESRVRFHQSRRIARCLAQRGES